MKRQSLILFILALLILPVATNAGILDAIKSLGNIVAGFFTGFFDRDDENGDDDNEPESSQGFLGGLFGGTLTLIGDTIDVVFMPYNIFKSALFGDDSGSIDFDIFQQVCNTVLANLDDALNVWNELTDYDISPAFADISTKLACDCDLKIFQAELEVDCNLNQKLCYDEGGIETYCGFPRYNGVYKATSLTSVDLKSIGCFTFERDGREMNPFCIEGQHGGDPDLDSITSWEECRVFVLKTSGIQEECDSCDVCASGTGINFTCSVNLDPDPVMYGNFYAPTGMQGDYCLSVGLIQEQLDSGTFENGVYIPPFLTPIP